MFLAKNAFATAHTAVSNFAVGHARPHQCGMEEKKLKKIACPSLIFRAAFLFPRRLLFSNSESSERCVSWPFEGQDGA